MGSQNEVWVEEARHIEIIKTNQKEIKIDGTVFKIIMLILMRLMGCNLTMVILVRENNMKINRTESNMIIHGQV